MIGRENQTKHNNLCAKLKKTQLAIFSFEHVVVLFFWYALVRSLPPVEPFLDFEVIIQASWVGHDSKILEVRMDWWRLVLSIILIHGFFNHLNLGWDDQKNDRKGLVNWVVVSFCLMFIPTWGKWFPSRLIFLEGVETTNWVKVGQVSSIWWIRWVEELVSHKHEQQKWWFVYKRKRSKVLRNTCILAWVLARIHPVESDLTFLGTLQAVVFEP